MKIACKKWFLVLSIIIIKYIQILYQINKSQNQYKIILKH